MAKEAHVSGAAGASFKTNWFILQISNTIRKSPPGGDYSGIIAESKEMEKKYNPFVSKIEEIVIKFKKNEINQLVQITDDTKPKYLKDIIIEENDQSKINLPKDDIFYFSIRGPIQSNKEFHLTLYTKDRIKKSTISKLQSEISSLLNTN